MATGSDILLPSKEKTNFLRLTALVIDGGTLALKTQFDAKFPPLNLGQDLQAHGNYEVLSELKNQKILKQAQFSLLFPPPPKNTDSTDFDICLFSCLIQSLPAFQQQNSSVWKELGPPAPTDFTLAADVKRLRLLRNFISHQTSATLTDQEFQARWQEASDVIQRLCTTCVPGIPGIQNYIANSLQLSIDPEKEQEYIDKLKQWEDIDDRLERQEILVADLQDRLSKQEEVVGSCRSNVDVLEKDLSNVKIEMKTCQEAIDSTSKNTSYLSGELEKVKERTDDIVADQEAQKKMSSEFRALVSRSKLIFTEKECHEFIETASYNKALKILTDNKIVILSGHPGEGKTTMAKHLLYTLFPAERCVNLREPEDWTHLDLSLNLVNAILIDDIFGSGVLEEHLAKNWERKLEDLATAIKVKPVHVVITSRHYILEETKRLFRTLPLFKKENVQFLSSKDLTHDEKIRILKSHLTAEKRKIEEAQIPLCITSHASILENPLFGTKDFLFGFPECVNLFARQNDLFDKGPIFFSQPYTFVKNFIHQLYRDEEKFLALIILWANGDNSLKKSELNESKLSDRVSWIAKKFNFKLKSKLIKQLRRSLDYHVDGLLHFSKETGIYTFGHNVICDMVGIVIATENPDEVIEFCSRGFLLTYVTTQPTDDEFKFCVEEYLFKELARRFIALMIENISLEGFLDYGISIALLNRGGKMKSTVKPTFAIDFRVIKHDAFLNEKFTDLFLDTLSEKGYLEKLLAQEIMEMSGFFLRYGLKIDQQKYFLLSYLVFIGADIFAERIILENWLQRTALSEDEKTMDYTMALFFAVHHQKYTLAKALLERVSFITEEVLYIAAHKTDMNILKLLLGKPDKIKLPNIEIVNGNNGLIVAAKKGFVSAVKCFIECGYNLAARNKDGVSALDKAISYKHEDICELLVKAGAPINDATRKFKRTPLHSAVDIGLTAVTNCLLQNGAKVKTRDHKGFYPIHSAALNRHFDIIRILLRHDPEQAKFQTKTYGKKSVLKGKTIFHIAIHKKDYELLSVLLQAKANPNVTDWYGKTVFLESVFLGNLKFINMLKDVADMNISDKNGFTPLHVAVYKGYFTLVNMICSNPLVNINAKDNYGKTPLHVATLKGFRDIFFALVFLYKADWRMITNRGDTVPHIAVRGKLHSELLMKSEFSGEIDEAVILEAFKQLNSSGSQTNDAEIIYQRTAGSSNSVTQENEEEAIKRNAADIVEDKETEKTPGDEAIAGSPSCTTNAEPPTLYSLEHTGRDKISTSDIEPEEMESQHLDSTVNEDDDSRRIRLKNSIVNHLLTRISYSPELVGSHYSDTQSSSDIYGSERAISNLEVEKTSPEDYNSILNVMIKFDEDFIQRGLKNKFGQKIVFCDVSGE